MNNNLNKSTNYYYEMNKKEKMYGWYSNEASKIQKRIVTYTNTDGENVIVSSVTSTPDDSCTNFKDIVFVGELRNFVSSVENNQYH